MTNKFLEKHKKPDNIYPNLTIFSTNEEKKHNVNNINISHLNINLQKKFQKKKIKKPWEMAKGRLGYILGKKKNKRAKGKTTSQGKKKKEKPPGS